MKLKRPKPAWPKKWFGGKYAAARKRIKKILFCVLAVGITGVPAIFLNTIYGYLPGIVVVVGILSSFGYLQLLKKTLTYEELSDLSNCQRGTEVEFTVKIENKFLLIYPKLELQFYISDLFGADDTVTESVITLAPREKRQFDFTVRFDHIGTYSAGLKRIKIYDLLGLFSHEVKNSKEYQVNVAPKIFDIAALRISNTTLTESQKMVIPTVIDGSDYAGVREYVWGDPIKTIHWKLSARTETYMTKQFESYGVTGVSIILDFLSPEYESETMMSIFDSVVETGLSIAEYAQENGMEYEILYTDRRGEKKKANTQRHIDYVQLIRDMPKISAQGGDVTGIDLLREECNNLYSQGNIAFCTANITDEMVNVLTQIHNQRKNPILFAMIPEYMKDEEKEDRLKPLRVLDQANISYYILSSAKELGGGEKK